MKHKEVAIDLRVAGLDFGCTGERFIASNIATEKGLQATGCGVEEGAMEGSQLVRGNGLKDRTAAPHLIQSRVKNSGCLRAYELGGGWTQAGGWGQAR